MTQPYEYDDEDFDETDDDEDSKPARTDQEWAELRRARKARDKALKELEGFKREKAFNKAGIDPDDPKFAYFVKGYEGDITPEAIRAEARPLGGVARRRGEGIPAVKQELFTVKMKSMH